jgi:hypothetical protein
MARPSRTRSIVQRASRAGEIKTVEGRDGMLQINAYYDDDLKRLERYGG